MLHLARRLPVSCNALRLSLRTVVSALSSDMPSSFTPMEDLPGIVGDMRQHRSGIPMEKRRELLGRLVELLKVEMPVLQEAEFKDLRRPKEFGGRIIEGCVSSTALALEKLDEWTQIRKCPLPVAGPGSNAVESGVRYEPRGVALIIGTWNFPIPLVIKPLASAIAAGCPIIVKLNRACPHTSLAMKELFEKYLDPEYVRCVYGSAAQTTALLEEKLGVIFYTGSPNIGKIICEAAAKHLTPCIMELGGKNPVFVTKQANLKTAAWKLIDTKFLNVGQFCVSPDHVYVDPEVDMDTFKGELFAAAKSFFGENPQKSNSLSRVISEHHFKRIAGLLKDHGGEVLMGGMATADVDDLYVPPTIVLNPKEESMLMNEEIFGPIMPIIVSPLDAALRSVNERPDPLALYIFSEDDGVVKHILENTRSGGVGINDCIQHMLNETLPFGGLGESGFGNYHGEWGFKAFSHERAFMKFSAEDFPKQRFPPYTN